MAASFVAQHNNDEAAIQWAVHDKTILLKDGGNSKRLTELWKNLNHRKQEKFLFAEMWEDEDTLDEILAAVAVLITPEDKYGIYPANESDIGYAAQFGDVSFSITAFGEWSQWEREAWNLVMNSPLL